jgi:hypothetical protein
MTDVTSYCGTARKLRTLTFSLFWLIPVVVFTQTDQETNLSPPLYMDFNVNGQIGVPLQTFQDNLSSHGYGLGAYFLIQVSRHVPVQAGLEGGWQRFEREDLDFTEIIDGQEREFRLSTRVNIVTGHAVLRFQPTVDFPIWPFVDGMFGFKHIYARTALKEKVDLITRETLEVETDKNDTALSYGVAAGIQVGLFPEKIIRLEARVAYLPGNSASYFARVDNSTGPYSDPLEAFEERQSPTDMLVLQLGITVDIGRY